MDQETWRALIEVVPALAWVLLAAAALLLVRRQLPELLGRLRDAELPGGFRLSFAAEQLEQAAERAVERGVSVTPAAQERALERARRSRDVLLGARLLWVDDEPAGNWSERRLLRSLGVVVDNALSTGDALERLRRDDYDVVVTDMRRGDDPEAGLELIGWLREQHPGVPAIVYLFELDRSLGRPEGSLGVTNRPDELLSLVVWALQRPADGERGQPAV